MKKPRKKLKLTRETIRKLTPGELSTIQGGNDPRRLTTTIQSGTTQTM